MLISTNSRKKGDEMPDYLRLEAFRTTPLVKQPFRSTVTTVRGRCDLSDGKIHTDSKSKIITVLLYMNETWEQADGRLRLLRSATDLNGIIVEVPARSWHSSAATIPGTVTNRFPASPASFNSTG